MKKHEAQANKFSGTLLLKGSLADGTMSEEQLQALLMKVAENADWKTKLNQAEDADAVVSWAKEAGFEITVDAFQRAPMEVSEEELETVVGSGAAAVVRCTRPACLTATSKNNAVSG